MNEDIESINYENVRIKGYDLEFIKDLKITSIINNHSILNLTGILKEEVKDKDIFFSDNDKEIEVYFEDEKNTTIFYGIVTNVEIEADSNVYMINIEAKSMSYLMDIKIKSRSFQDISMKTHDLVSLIMMEYPDSNVNFRIPNEPVNELLIQYEETDWEFLIRFVSKYSQGLFVSMESRNINYSVGTPETFYKIKTPNIYFDVYKELELYEYMMKNYFNDAIETDYITYKITNYEFLKLGDNIKINDLKFYTFKAEYEIKGGILENTYKLRMKNGLRQKNLFNTKVIGTSIKGKIINVKDEVVQIHLDIDELQDPLTAYWFKFSTMSASSDGSGWYCMPEIGDSVRAYFPTKDEDETFAISAVSDYKQGAGESEDRMGNPDNKYLRTINDKQVKLTPDGIFISCDSGQADMNLKSNGTLSITSQNNINVVAKENIKIEAGKKFLITSTETINILCDKNGGIVFDESGQIKEMGVQVNNNYDN